MKTGRPKLGVEREQLARLSHLENVPELTGPKLFNAILEWLIPAPISRPALLALFDGKAKYEAIRSWRADRTKPPQWAVDALDRKLAAYAAEVEARRAALQRCVGPGIGGPPSQANLARWQRERRSALPHCAAPPTSPA